MTHVNKDTIREKLEGYAKSYELKIEMWKKVKRLTKKDGSDFQNFGKNFEGAKIERWYDDVKLVVSDWSQDRQPHYISDEINTRVLVEDWKHGEIAEDRIIKVSGLKPFFYLNPEETMLLIDSTIEKYEYWRNGYIKDLEKLDQAYDLVKNGLDEIYKGLEEICGTTYKSSLYYALVEKIKDFPY